MEVKAYKLNSFTQEPNGGNPAGVVLGAEELNELQMQQLAGIIGYSETAFVSHSDKADFKVRFFTPNEEVDLCGHGTIAAFSLLKQRAIVNEGKFTQETKAGVLKIIIDSSIYMQQAAPQFYEIIEGAEVTSCLGISELELDSRIPVQIVSTGVRDILVPVKNIEILEKLIPDMIEIEQISKKYNVTGLHVFTTDTKNEKDAICRNFAPLYGIPEESATGTSNGALAAYLHKYQLLHNVYEELVFEQGRFMDKPSIIKARLKTADDLLLEVWVGGEAVFVGEEAYNI